MFTFQITGLDELIDAMQQYSEAAQQKAEAIIEDTSNKILHSAKNNAPEKMKDSIKHKVSKDRLRATISADAPGAVHEEYGHDSGPFMNPAFEEHRHGLLKKFHHLIKK